MPPSRGNSFVGARLPESAVSPWQVGRPYMLVAVLIKGESSSSSWSPVSFHFWLPLLYQRMRVLMQTKNNGHEGTSQQNKVSRGLDHCFCSKVSASILQLPKRRRRRSQPANFQTRFHSKREDKLHYDSTASKRVFGVSTHTKIGRTSIGKNCQHIHHLHTWNLPLPL